MKTILSTLLLFFGPLFTLLAQDDASKRALTSNEIMITTVFVLLGFLVIFLGMLVGLLIKLRNFLQPLIAKSEEEVLYDKQDFWSKVFQLKPIEMDKKLVMDHAYDGIQELDNPTPPWFMFLFYSTIAFAIVYGIVYHGIGDGKIMENEYAAELKQAEIVHVAYLKKYAGSINENNVKVETSKEKLAEGKSIYDNNCVACHGTQGEGKVGPNLTDEFWIHGGGDIKNVFRTVSEGVAEKGMIAWKKNLDPLQIQLVSSYILSMKGSNPANPKAPQGLKVGEKPASPDSTSL